VQKPRDLLLNPLDQTRRHQPAEPTTIQAQHLYNQATGGWDSTRKRMIRDIMKYRRS
jgi:hypothetical protein